MKNYSFPSAWLRLILVVLALIVQTGCESVKYVKSELTGTAKPDGGIQESIPASKTYNASPQAVRRATLQILDDQGYVYEENPSTGTIRTEPKTLNETKSTSMFGAYYPAKLFIKLDGATVTYRAKFDKKSNLTMDVQQNVEFPEKEAELRKEFFKLLDRKLSTSQSTQAAPSVTRGTVTPPPPSVVESQPQTKTVSQIQKRLSELGYQPGSADGKMGKNTVEALKKYQRDNKLAVTGQVDTDTVASLLQKSDAPAKSSTPQGKPSAETPQKPPPSKTGNVNEL